MNPRHTNDECSGGVCDYMGGCCAYHAQPPSDDLIPDSEFLHFPTVGNPDADAERDRYRAALEAIVAEQDVKCGGLYCNFCGALEIASKALTGKEKP